MTLHQYDPKQVSLIFGGSLITGFAPDSFINVEYNVDLFSLLVGADGEGSRSKSNNNSARVTVTLMPGSVGNALLNVAFQADKAGGAGAAPLAITDPSTGTLFASEGAWVVRDPGKDFQGEAQPMEWILETDNMQSFYGAAV